MLASVQQYMNGADVKEDIVRLFFRKRVGDDSECFALQLTQ